jgi:galactokinase
MIRPDVVEQFKSAITHSYKARYGLTPEFYSCRPSAGAAEIAGI